MISFKISPKITSFSDLGFAVKKLVMSYLFYFPRDVLSFRWWTPFWKMCIIRIRRSATVSITIKNLFFLLFSRYFMLYPILTFKFLLKKRKTHLILVVNSAKNCHWYQTSKKPSAAGIPNKCDR